ncbi:MAG: DUF5615 family PIN-like protein [Bifidobacteriaceae bacterium]|nr:DUF5615 family PIN-like protein [Bifidobacteriaceae bacterium]
MSPPPAARLRLLLDEHYSSRLAQLLRQARVDAVAIAGERPALLGAPDVEILRAASAESRVVVTEDVSTFPAAIAQVPDHCGVVYCRSRVFRRGAAGWVPLRRALQALVASPPPGLGREPIVWWLSPPRQ